MHHIYHTNGFILSSRNVGEANKILSIYTKELGLVRAVVQGVRFNKSKLRFSLQDFSYTKIDFVRGKDIWRITSAENINSFPFARREKKSLLLIIRVSRLLERLCKGEESNESIFNDLIQAFYFLDNINVKSDSREAIELHLVLKIMHSLGYIGESVLLNNFIGSDFNNNLTENILNKRQSIIAYINKALNESQL